MNTLYFGDNLEIMREKIPSDYLDLIYFDPPFKSRKSCNIIFQPKLEEIKSQQRQFYFQKDNQNKAS